MCCSRVFGTNDVENWRVRLKRLRRLTFGKGRRSRPTRVHRPYERPIWEGARDPTTQSGGISKHSMGIEENHHCRQYGHRSNRSRQDATTITRESVGDQPSSPRNLCHGRIRHLRCMTYLLTSLGRVPKWSSSARRTPKHEVSKPRPPQAPIRSYRNSRPRIYDPRH